MKIGDTEGTFNATRLLIIETVYVLKSTKENILNDGFLFNEILYDQVIIRNINRNKLSRFAYRDGQCFFGDADRKYFVAIKTINFE